MYSKLRNIQATLLALTLIFTTLLANIGPAFAKPSSDYPFRDYHKLKQEIKFEKVGFIEDRKWRSNGGNIKIAYTYDLAYGADIGKLTMTLQKLERDQQNHVTWKDIDKVKNIPARALEKGKRKITFHRNKIERNVFYRIKLEGPDLNGQIRVNRVRFDISQKDPLTDDKVEQTTDQYDLKPRITFDEKREGKEEYRKINVALYPTDKNSHPAFANKNKAVNFNGAFHYKWKYAKGKPKSVKKSWSSAQSKSYQLSEVTNFPKTVSLNYFGSVGRGDLPQKLRSKIELVQTNGKVTIQTRSDNNGLHITGKTPFKGKFGKWKFKLYRNNSTKKAFYASPFLDGYGKKGTHTVPSDKLTGYKNLRIEVKFDAGVVTNHIQSPNGPNLPDQIHLLKAVSKKDTVYDPQPPKVPDPPKTPEPPQPPKQPKSVEIQAKPFINKDGLLEVTAWLKNKPPAQGKWTISFGKISDKKVDDQEFEYAFLQDQMRPGKHLLTIKFDGMITFPGDAKGKKVKGEFKQEVEIPDQDTDTPETVEIQAVHSVSENGDLNISAHLVDQQQATGNWTIDFDGQVETKKGTHEIEHTIAKDQLKDGTHPLTISFQGTADGKTIQGEVKLQLEISGTEDPPADDEQTELNPVDNQVVVGGPLPKTATSFPIGAVSGIAFLLSGSWFLYWNSRRKKEKDRL